MPALRHRPDTIARKARETFFKCLGPVKKPTAAQKKRAKVETIAILKDTYGASPDWDAILKFIMEVLTLLMTLL